MDIQENEGPSTLKGAAKVFAKRRLESSWQIKGVPGFITTTHRDKYSLCKQYPEHTVAASEKLTVEIPSHLMFLEQGDLLQSFTNGIQNLLSAFQLLYMPLSPSSLFRTSPDHQYAC